MTRSIQSARTSTHDYPREELNAMYQFYGGKRCVVRRSLENPEWAHILDASLHSSNERLKMMLERNLSEDRHPRHAAEVRENIVPLFSSIHRAMDQTPPWCTLFLHEDILLRTLAYEQDLQKWRIAELDAGRPDPGRPSYDEVFGGTRVTQHRFHCNDAIDPFPRVLDGARPSYQFYYNTDCPGVDNPDSLSPFPAFDTLLSIPFSLLHNLPRLSAMFPMSLYQRQLLTLGTKIVHLWSWDPSPHMVATSIAVRNQNCASMQQNDVPNPKPHPIHHPSRDYNYTLDDSISDAQPIPSFGTLTPCYIQDKHTIELPVGPIFVGIPTFASGTDEMQVTVTDEISLTVTDGLFAADGLADGEDNGLTKHIDGGLVAGITGSPVTSEAWSDTEDSDNSGDDRDVKAIYDESASCPSEDILLWYQKVVNSELEPAALIPTPFERGVIGSMSVNDVLMARGLINPTVYIQFIDLISFHHDAAHV